MCHLPVVLRKPGKHPQSLIDEINIRQRALINEAHQSVRVGGAETWTRASRTEDTGEGEAAIHVVLILIEVAHGSPQVGPKAQEMRTLSPGNSIRVLILLRNLLLRQVSRR